MSTVIAKNIQIGTSGTAAQNFTWYQPATPDGTVRLGVGNSGATTADLVTATSTVMTVAGTVTSRSASGRDAVALLGRAGGTSSFATTLTPTTLSANRTLTLPDNTGTVLTTGATVTIAQGGTGATSAANARNNLGTNDATNLNSGTVSTARLAVSGTASSTTFLRGDQTWNAPDIQQLANTSISSPTAGQALMYVSTTLAGGTFTGFSFAQWQKNSPEILIDSPSTDVLNRILACVNGTAITITLTSGGTTRNLTTTGPATGSSPTYYLPVNITSDTGSSETLTNITFPTLTTPATWRNSDAYESLATPATGSGGGTLAIGDRGALVSVTAGVTVPANVFALQDVVTIYNNSGSNITITQGASLTLRQVGTANTGNRTLAQRGLVTIVFISATEAVISGGGLT